MPDELTERIIGAAIEVHRELGPGLLESIYEEALCYEFDLQGIKHQRQMPADIIYKGKVIKGQKLRPSFPVDLLIRTPEKIRQRLEIGDQFIKDILQGGKVLYEARSQRTDKK